MMRQAGHSAPSLEEPQEARVEEILYRVAGSFPEMPTRTASSTSQTRYGSCGSSISVFPAKYSVTVKISPPVEAWLSWM